VRVISLQSRRRGRRWRSKPMCFSSEDLVLGVPTLKRGPYRFRFHRSIMRRRDRIAVVAAGEGGHAPFKRAWFRPAMGKWANG
jgi:hypothetical protein